MQNRRLAEAGRKLVFLRMKSTRRQSSNQVRRNGGAGRDRTDDPLLAKQVLSQLSYGPLIPGRDREEWWAWEDLNLRPHAYQARALTN